MDQWSWSQGCTCCIPRSSIRVFECGSKNAHYNSGFVHEAWHITACEAVLHASISTFSSDMWRNRSVLVHTCQVFASIVAGFVSGHSSAPFNTIRAVGIIKTSDAFPRTSYYIPRHCFGIQCGKLWLCVPDCLCTGTQLVMCLIRHNKLRNFSISINADDSTSHHSV